LQGNASNVDTSTLGKPVANYPTGHCDIDKFFRAQNLIFDITLCGGALSSSPFFQFFSSEKQLMVSRNDIQLFSPLGFLIFSLLPDFGESQYNFPALGHQNSKLMILIVA
jgi:hypothetical protein